MTAEGRPFLKWAGGKRRLLPQILPHVPRFGRYHEPFVGSGALFFHLGPPRATLSDNNERLVRAYRGLKDDVDGVIGLLSGYKHERRFYEKMREHDIDRAATDAEVAAWFIYLNKTGYNGLYRVNSKNRFNVPFGDYARPNFCDEGTLRSCAKMLKRTRIEREDFECAARRARPGDLVYFDPPYVPLSVTSSFTSYTSDGFDMEDQRRLRDVALSLKKRRVHVLISNSSAPAVYELYDKGFRIVEVSARRDINCKGGGRGEIIELLIS